MKLRMLMLLSLLITLQTQYVSAAESFVVVVHKNNPTQALNKSDLIDIYMGKKSAFPNGAKASPVDFELESEVRTQFYQALLGIPVARVNAYWSRIRFSGKVRPPLPQPDIASVLNYVETNNNAIAYIPEQNVTDDVKVVYRLNE